MSMEPLPLEPLSRAAFAPFGDVIDLDADWFPINQGTTRRYHALGSVQLLGAAGRAVISLAVAQQSTAPIMVRMLERHPLGSQAWIPRSQAPFVVVVAPNGPNDRPDESGLRAFLAKADQGVNYHAGVWHHPLLSLVDEGQFIVVDRDGPEPNCDEVSLTRSRVVDARQIEWLNATQELGQ